MDQSGEKAKDKEQHSINYFASICESAGMVYITDARDEDSTDGFVRKKTYLEGKDEEHIFFRVQLKSTSSKNLCTDSGDSISYKLKAKNYNDLCKKTNVPIILVLCILPENEIEWVEQDKTGDGKISLGGKLYWAEFSGKERTENRGTKTVDINKKNILDKNSLQELLKRIGKKEPSDLLSAKMLPQDHEQRRSNKNKSIEEAAEGLVSEIRFKGGCFPDGNVLHNGHIEYFPSVIAATPFNYLYVLISEEESGIVTALEEIFAEQLCKGQVWKEYTIQNFLNRTDESLCEEDNVRILVCMQRHEINFMESIIQTWRQDMADIPIVINICAGNKKSMETAEHAKAVLQKIDWGQEFENRQLEIESLILIQTDQYSIGQNGMALDKSNGDQLQRWRVWLSDRFYFRQVLDHCAGPCAKYLMCQRTPFCKGAELVEEDKRLRERCDREHFIRHKYMWEEC